MGAEKPIPNAERYSEVLVYVLGAVGMVNPVRLRRYEYVTEKAAIRSDV